MPNTSMLNIQANPSMRMTRFRPSAGNQVISSRNTPASAIWGKYSAVCTVQNSATRPASVDSVLRAFAGSTAASKLPTKGRRMRRVRGISV